MIIDRKTRREITAGQTIVRRNYKGFPSRYEVLEILADGNLRVRKLTPDDRWVYLTMRPQALQLDTVTDPSPPSPPNPT